MTETPSAGRDHGVRYKRAAGERRRVLFVVHSAKLGGAERLALSEAEWLRARFELLLSVPDGPLRSLFAAHGELVGEAATLPLWGSSAMGWARSIAGTLRDAVALARLIRARRVELVLTNSSVCLAPVLAAKLARVPVVVHARDVPKSRLAPMVMALQGKLASTVIVIADGLAPYFRVDRNTRLTKIVDGISVTELRGDKGPCGFRSPLRLCLIGGLDPRKGQDVAVSALAELRGRGLAATLDLVGRELDEQFAISVRNQAHALGVAEQLRFVGEVEDVVAHIDRADIVIAASRGEWTPLVLMEALARGKPVVATRVGGVAEVVRHRESGLLVDSEDPAALASAIAELAADPVAAKAMAERGHAHVAANFCLERTLEGLQCEIDRLLGRDSVAATRERDPLQAVI